MENRYCECSIFFYIYKKKVMDITEVIADLHTFTNEPVISGTLDELNITIDSTPLPCVYLTRLEQGGRLTEHNGFLLERQTYGIFFAAMGEHRSDAGHTDDDIIASRKNVGLKWLLHAMRSDVFKVIEIGSTARRYDEFDAGIVGFGFIVTLEERHPVVTICNL